MSDCLVIVEYAHEVFVSPSEAAAVASLSPEAASKASGTVPILRRSPEQNGTVCLPETVLILLLVKSRRSVAMRVIAKRRTQPRLLS
jgi:hypothetical protein